MYFYHISIKLCLNEERVEALFKLEKNLTDFYEISIFNLKIPQSRKCISIKFGISVDLFSKLHGTANIFLSYLDFQSNYAQFSVPKSRICIPMKSWFSVDLCSQLNGAANAFVSHFVFQLFNIETHLNFWLVKLGFIFTFMWLGTVKHEYRHSSR